MTSSLPSQLASSVPALAAPSVSPGRPTSMSQSKNGRYEPEPAACASEAQRPPR